MKNNKLKHLMKSVKYIESLDIREISIHEKTAITAGTEGPCTTLSTTCVTFVACNTKYHVAKPPTVTIEL